MNILILEISRFDFKIYINVLSTNKLTVNQIIMKDQELKSEK